MFSRRASRPAGIVAAVLAGGIVAGALDIAFACTYWALRADVPVLRIFQSVGAGLLGSSSFQGGAATAALGLALHFAMTLSMAWVWCLLATRWRSLLERPWTYGVGYGLLLYGVMQYLVVPLSAAPEAGNGTDVPWIAASILAHVVLVGWPIALFARRGLST